MRFNKRNRIFLVLSVALMAVIFWFSSKDATVSTEQSDLFITVFLDGFFDGQIPHWLTVVVRKAAHFSIYAALAFCLYFTFEGAVKSAYETFLYPLSVSVAYSVSDEIHQMFVPGRAGRLFDLAVDGCGSIFGIVTALLILTLIRKIKIKRSCR